MHPNIPFRNTQDIPDILLTPICWVKPGATAPSNRYTPSAVIPACSACSALVHYSATDPPISRLFPTDPLRINLATRCLPRATATRHALHATNLSCSRFYTRYTSHSPLSALDSLCHRPVLPAFLSSLPSHPPRPTLIHRLTYATPLALCCAAARPMLQPRRPLFTACPALRHPHCATPPPECDAARPTLHSCLSDAISLSSA
ncbi:hypothetical protein DFH08DRAFT_1075418 [Mycena albidolilacea]|uniref:Uncharacterized protein n=1 Tax=Mycena albidolilacea TaxID=1033008 RepID=A0AAD7AHX7_9AGAR|nr:hypothetical protein DFH08DRAFT_1075418 [Mycena albidolilacea]